MKLKQPNLIITEDGSNSIFLESINESYHSKFGAINESRHVFIEAGFDQINGIESINVLEVGFGTGLNALLTLLKAHEKKIMVRYDTIEPYPLLQELTEQLNYPEILRGKLSGDPFQLLHQAPFGSSLKINDFFIFRKIKHRLEKYSPDENHYDLVYFDAFSPSVQPELWTAEIFKKLFNSQKAGGIIVTYCAKGEVRRNLKKCWISG